MISKAYAKKELPSPSMFKDRFIDKSALIIGTGMSTKGLVQYKDQLRNKFDVIIGLNFSILDFDKQMTHHLLIEKKPIAIYTELKKEKYRRDLPRILNFKGLHRFPKDLNVIKATRTNFDGKSDIRKHNYNSCEGLLNGPINKDGFSIGTVTLQAVHLAGIMGCNNIYISGVDLVFGKEFDHYYEDRAYRDGHTGPNKSAIVKVTNNSKTYETTSYFRDSAEYLDEVVNTMCRPIGIEVYSFSDGLLTAPIKLDVDSFFGGK